MAVDDSPKVPEETSSVAVTRLTRFVRQTALSLASVILSTSALVLLATPSLPGNPNSQLGLAVIALAAALVEIVRGRGEDGRAFLATVALSLALVAVVATAVTVASLATCRVCS